MRRASSAKPLSIVSAMSLVSLLLVAPSAWGEPRDAGAAAAAQKLFEEGRALMNEGRTAEACPKLAASQRLDPGAGTLLNLGECYEKTDKLASAWATYREAEAVAQRAGQKERATHCGARAQALFQKLSYLTIHVASHVPGLSIRRNGDVVPEVTLATAIPVDGGAHVIEASAPGRRPWKQVVQVRSSGEQAKIAVPELAQVSGPTEAGAGATREPSSNLQRTIGWATVGVGAAVFGTGLVFGAIAKSHNDEANDGHCTAVDCDARGVALLRDAKDASTVSTVLVLGGAAVAVTGVVLVLTSPRGPSVPPTRVGASLRGASVSFDLVW